MLARLSATDLRRFGYAKLARHAWLDLSGGACWVLTRLAKQGATAGPELARQAGVTDLRAMCDAISYVVRNGIGWRAVPVNFPDWDSVYALYERSSRRGLS